MIKKLLFLFILCLSGCYSPFYRKTGVTKEAEIEGWTKIVTYKKTNIRLSKKKKTFWPQYAKGKTKRYTYNSQGYLRKLVIEKSTSYGFKWDTDTKTKLYNEKGKRIRK